MILVPIYRAPPLILIYVPPPCRDAPQERPPPGQRSFPILRRGSAVRKRSFSRSEELHCPAKDLFPFAEEVLRSEKDLFLVPKSFAAPPKIFFCSLKRFCGQKKIFFLFRRASPPRQRSFFVPRRGLEVRKKFFSWLKFYSLVKNRIFGPREGDC